MNLPMPLKIIPEAVSHLGIDQFYSPFWELKEGQQVDWNAGQAGLDQDKPPSIGEKFPSPAGYPLNYFIYQRLEIFPAKLLMVKRDP